MKGDFPLHLQNRGPGDFQNIWGGGAILEPENTAYSTLASLFVSINPFTVMQDTFLLLINLMMVYEPSISLIRIHIV